MVSEAQAPETIPIYRNQKSPQHYITACIFCVALIAVSMCAAWIDPNWRAPATTARDTTSPFVAKYLGLPLIVLFVWGTVRAVKSARNPRPVLIVSVEGVTHVSESGEQLIPWSDISCAEVKTEKVGLHDFVPYLYLYGATGDTPLFSLPIGDLSIHPESVADTMQYMAPQDGSVQVAYVDSR